MNQKKPKKIIDYDYLRREYVKCLMDKTRIYMIEHFLKTYDATQKKDVQYILFPRQKDLCRTLGNANSVVTTKPRQAGITTTCGAFIGCEMCLADPESPQTVLIIGNTLDLAQQMLTKIKDFLLQFPLWMWGDEFADMGYDLTLPPENTNVIFDICNSKELKLKNGCKVVARSSGPNASRGVGGVTWLIFDEAAFIENGADVYASALPTISTGGHTIMISTPNGKDLLYYETCRRAGLKGTEDWNGFELVELKWFQDPRYNKFLEWYKKNTETGEIEVVKETYLDKKGSVKFDQAHWDEMEKAGYKPRSPWYIRMCQQFNNDEQKIAQELDVSFLGSASNVVAPEFIEMQEKLNMRDPVYKDPVIEDMWIWKKPIAGHRYLCACLPEGELVKTKDGDKKIESVVPTDVLFNKDGLMEKIVECKRRFVANEDIFSFRVSNYCRPLKFTGEHPLFVSYPEYKRWYSKTDNTVYRFNERYHEHNFSFVPAKEVKEGGWLMMPNTYYERELTEEELLEKGNKYGLEKEFKDPRFWWYCGIWVAEGIANNNGGNWRINTTHNVTETKFHLKIMDFIENVLGRSSGYREIGTAANIFFAHKNMARFLLDNFGRGALNKHLPEFVKKLPLELKKQFVEGYFCGDGSLYENKRDGLLCTFGSVSFDLLKDLQDILYSFGIISCLSVSHGERYGVLFNRSIHENTLYELALSREGTKALMNILYDTTFEIRPEKVQNCYFSKDKKFIYFKIKTIIKEKYTGYVYNFETETHSFCTNRCVTHNCDNSRGDAADRTAVEVIDMDGVDDDGKPCIEQVAEYHGKMMGDDVAELIYQYANLYGEAFVVVECIGGVGDATILGLQRLKYTNLYYDDPNLKTYTIQREATSLPLTPEGKLPGFHSQSVRFQMLTSFANMVKTNQIKIRSKRVIQELETWIYKGEAARIDHMDGCHDDTLTCLAMAMFVMQHSLGKIKAAMERDAAFLKAWVNTAMLTAKAELPQRDYNEEVDAKPKFTMPFYTNKPARGSGNPQTDALMWLIK